MTQNLHMNEDNLIDWKQARLLSTSAYVNAGTGTWVLKDSIGATITFGTMTYVASSNGRWQGVIDKTGVDDLTEGDTYFVEVTLEDGAGADGFRRIECVAQYHED